MHIRNNRKRNIMVLCSVAAGIIMVVLAAVAAITYSKVDVTHDIIPDRHPPTLFDPEKKEIAMKLVSSAENSSTDWRAQYGYIEES